MNSWWLKLYTIPQVKRLALSFLIATAIVCCGHNYMPEKILLFYAIYFLPMIVFFSGTSEGMAANLDFHKVSIPMTVLRKAFFTDLFIQITACILMALMSLFIPVLLFFPTEGMTFITTYLGLSPSFFLLVCAAVYSGMFSMRLSKFKLNTQQTKVEFSKRQKRGFVLFFAPIVFFIFFDDGGMPQEASESTWLDQFNDVFIVSTIFISSVFGNIFHFAMTKFHVIREQNNFKGHFLSFSSAFMGSVAFCFVCGFLFSFEVNSSFYSVPTKIKSLAVFSDFLPVIEPDTVQDIMNTTTNLSDVVFRNADPEVYQMPVEEIIKVKDLGAYAQYLRWGKPSERNLVYIMNELEEHPKAKDWREIGTYREVKYRLVQHWPNARSLPDGLIKEKIVTKKVRQIASEKKGP